MDRVKRIAYNLLDEYGKLFTSDYEENKKALDRIAIVRSKQLRNELVGFITHTRNAEETNEKRKGLAATLENPQLGTVSA